MNQGRVGSSSENFLDEVLGTLLKHYQDDSRAQYINRRFIPDREEILLIQRQLLELFFPGYYGRQGLTSENLELHVRGVLTTLQERLEVQIELCLCHGSEREQRMPDVPVCRQRGRRVAEAFLRQLPELRSLLLLDIQAAYDGDPAAASLDEIILAYPGLLAVAVYRVAHALHRQGVPFMPRIMTEWAHSQTGADIHPGASIGERFFIDHATGVVIGETSVIGAGVKLYQGVTLGALSFPKDAHGNLIRGAKRHPTVEDDVTIYANATVLGGDTVIGRGCVIGGSVFITRSVPPGHKVMLDPPRLRVASAAPPPPQPEHLDYDI